MKYLHEHTLEELQFLCHVLVYEKDHRCENYPHFLMWYSEVCDEIDHHLTIVNPSLLDLPAYARFKPQVSNQQH
jgi:hypothetical protein